jgi:ferredoxin-NADP reductase
MTIEQIKLSLKRVRKLSETTRDFRFIRDDGLPVIYRPGQFYRFHFTDDQGTFERSYSVANWESDGSSSAILDLVISYVEGGRASQYLFDSNSEQLIRNLRCYAKGPYGRLVVPTRLPERLILVATSVGLAPYIPMLNQLRELMKASNLAVELILGVRSFSEFFYRDELLDFARQHDQFSMQVCFSREDIGRQIFHDIAEISHRGYVQDVLKQMQLDPDQDHILLCGNPNMIDDVYSELKSRGFGVRNVVREKYVYAREKVAPTKQTLRADQKKLLAEKMAKFKKNPNDS